MASEDAINAKFEAFEARMEDKIQTLLTEFSLGRPPSPKKSHQGESSNQSNHAQRDDFQERGGSITDPYYPRMRVDFSKSLTHL